MHKLSSDAFIFIIFICEPFCWKYRSKSYVIKIFSSDFVVTSLVKMQGVIFTTRFTSYWQHCQQYGKEYSIWKSFRQSIGVFLFYFTAAKLTFLQFYVPVIISSIINRLISTFSTQWMTLRFAPLILVENNASTGNLSSSGSHSLFILKMVLYCAIWPIICTCGIFGNILTLIVLFKVGDKSTALQCLKGLSVADSVTLFIRLVYIPFVLCQLFWPDEYLTWTVNSFSMLKLSFPVEKISKCTIVTIVFDRIIAIVWPFKYKTICTPTHTTATIVIIAALVISSTLTYSVDVFIHAYEIGPSNSTYLTTQKEARQYLMFQIRTSKVRTIHAIINRVLFDVIPIPSVIISNVVIIIGLRRRSSLKSTSGESNQTRKYQDRQLTKLLLVVSFSFLTLCAPFDVSSFISITGDYDNEIPKGVVTSLITEILTTLTLLNSSINFVIYSVMNKRYSQGYISSLKCLARNEKENVFHKGGSS